MIIPTHKLIANQIQKSVFLNTKIKLDEKNLILGSILPDIAPKYIKQKHFFCVSYEYILNMIEDLYKESKIISIKEFSKRLGIITHYVSDFFCTPHNDRNYYKNRIKEHLIFESRLHFLFDEKNHISKIDIPSISTINYNNIKNLLDTLHLEYENNKVSYENDFYSTLNAVNTLSCLIVSHSFNS